MRLAHIFLLAGTWNCNHRYYTYDGWKENLVDIYKRIYNMTCFIAIKLINWVPEMFWRHYFWGHRRKYLFTMPDNSHQVAYSDKYDGLMTFNAVVWRSFSDTPGILLMLLVYFNITTGSVQQSYLVKKCTFVVDFNFVFTKRHNILGNTGK